MLVEEVVYIILRLDGQINARQLMVILIRTMVVGSLEEVHLREHLPHVSPSHIISLWGEEEFGMKGVV